MADRSFAGVTAAAGSVVPVYLMARVIGLTVPHDHVAECSSSIPRRAATPLPSPGRWGRVSSRPTAPPLTWGRTAVAPSPGAG